MPNLPKKESGRSFHSYDEQTWPEKDMSPAVVCECHPIDLRLSVAFPKRIGLWFPDKDEIALFGRQHHLIPIDHMHVTSMITEQIGWMQIRVTDDVGEWARL